MIFVPILAIFLKITNSKHNSVGLCTIHDVANTHAACPVCGYIWWDEFLTKNWLILIKIWPIWSFPTLSQNLHSADPSEIVAMLDNWFWCLAPGFWVLDIYMMLRSIWRSKTGWRGCRKPRTTSRSEVVILVLSMLETWFWCQVPYSWSIGNHLGPFLGASAQSWGNCRRPRTTSWSGDNYNEWKCIFGSESAGYLIFGSKPKFFGHDLAKSEN